MKSHLPDFGKFPIDAAIDRRPDRLSYNDYIVLSVLYAFADGDGYCYPPRSLLAMITGISVATISRITSHLVELGWLVKSGPRGRSRPNEYFLRVPEFLAEKVLEINTLYEKQRMQKSHKHSNRKDVTIQHERVQESSTPSEQTNNKPKRKRRVDGLPLSVEFLEKLEQEHAYINIYRDLERLQIYMREKGERVRDMQARAERWLMGASKRNNGEPESGSWFDRQRSIVNREKRRSTRLMDKATNLAIEYANKHSDARTEEIEKYATENIPSEFREHFVEVVEGMIFHRKHPMGDDLLERRNGMHEI